MQQAIVRMHDDVNIWCSKSSLSHSELKNIDYVLSLSLRGKDVT